MLELPLLVCTWWDAYARVRCHKMEYATNVCRLLLLLSCLVGKLSPKISVSRIPTLLITFVESNFKLFVGVCFWSILDVGNEKQIKLKRRIQIGYSGQKILRVEPLPWILSKINGIPTFIKEYLGSRAGFCVCKRCVFMNYKWFSVSAIKNISE